jgi:hypothetical protein
VCLVHRLVAQAFIANTERHTVINHIDANKENNPVRNLEWCSYSHNNQHARDLGINNNKGSLHGMAKLSEIDVRLIREKYRAGGVLHRELADEFRVRTGTITDIINKNDGNTFSSKDLTS